MHIFMGLKSNLVQFIFTEILMGVGKVGEVQYENVKLPIYQYGNSYYKDVKIRWS